MVPLREMHWVSKEQYYEYKDDLVPVIECTLKWDFKDKCWIRFHFKLKISIFVQFNNLDSYGGKNPLVILYVSREKLLVPFPILLSFFLKGGRWPLGGYPEHHIQEPAGWDTDPFLISGPSLLIPLPRTCFVQMFLNPTLHPSLRSLLISYFQWGPPGPPYSKLQTAHTSCPPPPSSDLPLFYFHSTYYFQHK